MKFALITILSLCFFSQIQAQFTVKGTLQDKNKKGIEMANIALEGTSIGTSSDANGNFTLNINNAGTYKLVISIVGYEKITKEITLTSTKKVENLGTIQMTTKKGALDEIVVSEKSESTVVAEQAIRVTSIDTKALKSESTNVIGILTRASGVRVRQSGGLGSGAEVQLNGLTGNAVRQYYDGIPLELLGGGIQLNNIPVNAIDRIDIYKGVMPIDIGTDALAGGVNIVPKEIYGSYLDASYEFGSFNTHVVAVNGAKTIQEHFFVAFNGFFNYSDNDYEMRNIPVQ